MCLMTVGFALFLHYRFVPYRPPVGDAGIIVMSSSVRTSVRMYVCVYVTTLPKCVVKTDKLCNLGYC